MPTATVTTKGQITVPKAVRDRMGLRKGDQVDFVEDDGVFRLRKHLAVNPFEKWRDYLKDQAGTDPDELVEEMRGR